jgi:hypothetical protein
MFKRRPDTLREFEPAWARPLAYVLGLTLIAIIVLTVVVQSDWWCFYAGFGWLISVGVLGLSSNFIAAARLNRSLQNKWNNCCPTCGYNLTANCTGICPECGTPIPQVFRDFP